LANGEPSAKLFKLKETVLKPGETEHFQKKVSVADMTTRKHYPGRHRVDVASNGQLRALSHFDLER
jgi:phosphopantetheinyl transferase (holo-ACP synthase)